MPKRLWTCDCGASYVIGNKRKIAAGGKAFNYLDEFIRCSECGGRFRFAPELRWLDSDGKLVRKGRGQ